MQQQDIADGYAESILAKIPAAKRPEIPDFAVVIATDAKNSAEILLYSPGADRVGPAAGSADCKISPQGPIKGSGGCRIGPFREDQARIT
ncbi:hypothetical protein [Nitrobacter sp.]|uniref:hypothetical protein n=1 Tax=Nitrobacter sp. TaxID=29420 RepID=UPI0029CABFC1|nr:hypothetical protein [Nitrobacter sp.]